MYGSIARIGIICSEYDSTINTELWKMIAATDGIEIYNARFPLYPARFPPSGLDADELFESRLLSHATQIEWATRLLLPIRPTSITYGCTSGSFLKGPEYTRSLIEKINKVAPNVPASTVTSACMEASKELEINEVAVATLYSKKFNERLEDYLEKMGFQVVNMQGFPLEDTSPEDTYRQIRSVDTPDANGVFVACTGWCLSPKIEGVSVVEKLEQDLKKPVVWSNGGTLWDALRKAKFSEPIKGFGTLLTRL